MPQPHRRPLEQLIQQCRPSHPEGAPGAPAAYRELLRRAVCQENNRAWEAVMPFLRATVLRYIYAQVPEINPQEAERLLFMALMEFLAQLHRRPDLPHHFPTYTSVLTLLEESVGPLLQNRGLDGRG